MRNIQDWILTACQAPYSVGARLRVRAEIERFRPDVVHVHNFFPLLTPSIYDACRAAGVPVVQTLHNFRLGCLNASLFRAGHVCEDCLGRAVPWPGVVHACYRGSRAASAAVAAMLMLHRIVGTWVEKVDAYIAPTDFVRTKLIQSGLPAEKIVVKPHFVHPDPGRGEGRGGYALFVGRLTMEKGLDTLLAAWRRLRRPIPLKLVGEAPSPPQVAGISKPIQGLEWLGAQSRPRVQALMQNAVVLLFPSRWYETFGLVIAEAYAAGVPVVAGNHGSISDLVHHGRTGLHFALDDPDDLAEKVAWMCSHRRERDEMGRGARHEFEQKYSAERNYPALLDVYARARERAQRSAVAQAVQS